MVTFTTIIDRGHQKFIDQNFKKRVFGNCGNCSKFYLLISTTLQSVKTKEKMEINICEECYNTILFGSEK